MDSRKLVLHQPGPRFLWPAWCLAGGACACPPCGGLVERTVIGGLSKVEVPGPGSVVDVVAGVESDDPGLAGGGSGAHPLWVLGKSTFRVMTS